MKSFNKYNHKHYGQTNSFQGILATGIGNRILYDWKSILTDIVFIGINIYNYLC